MTRDAERNRRLLLDGWRVIEVTWTQLREQAGRDALELDLRIALSHWASATVG